MIRYAVVGAGWISQEAFIPGVAQSGNSRIEALVTGDLAKAQKLAAFDPARHGGEIMVTGQVGREVL